MADPVDPRSQGHGKSMEDIFNDLKESADAKAAQEGVGGIIGRLDVVTRKLTDLIGKSFMTVELGEETRKALRSDGEAQVTSWLRKNQMGMTPRNAKGGRIPNVGGRRSDRVFAPKNTLNQKLGGRHGLAGRWVSGEAEGMGRFFNDARGALIRPDGNMISPMQMPGALAGLAKKGLRNRPGEGYGGIMRTIGGHTAISAAINPKMLANYSNMASWGYNNLLGGSDISAMSRLGLAGEHGVGTAAAGLANQALGLETLSFLTGANLAFGGEGQRAAVGDRIDSFWNTINPFDALSFGDDQQIKGITRGMGFRFGSGEEKEVIQSFRNLKNQGFNPEEVAPLIDLFVKKLGVAADEVEKTIEQFTQRAIESGKSLDEYTKIVTSVSQRMVSQGVDENAAMAYADFAAGFKHVTPDSLANIGKQAGVFETQWLQENAPDLLTPEGYIRFKDNKEAALGPERLASFQQGVIQKGVEFWMRGPFNFSEEDAINRYASQSGMTPAEVKELYEMDPEKIAQDQERLNFEEDLLKGEGIVEDAETKAFMDNFDSSMGTPAEIEIAKEKARKRVGAREEQDRLIREYRDMLGTQGDLSDDEMKKVDKMISEGKDASSIIEEVRKITARKEEDVDKKEKTRVLIEASPRLERLLTITSSVDEEKTETERNQRNKYLYGVSP